MNRKAKEALCIILSVVFVSDYFSAMAQQWVPNFKHYGIPDGLPSSEVYQVTSDAQKNLWFVTDRGVVKYDGTVFRVFDKKDSLPDNSVIKVYKDRKGRIWFISYTGLLSYYENGKIVPYRYNALIRSKLGVRIFTALYVDPNETVFVNGIEGVVYAIDSAGRFFKDILPSDVSSFTIADTAAVPSTFYSFNANVKTLTRIKVYLAHQAINIIEIKENMNCRHFSTRKLRNGDLLLYSDNVFVRIRPDKSYELRHFDSRILNIFEDNERHLWIGCFHDGVYEYDSTMKTFSHYFTDLSISHIYSDYENGLWFSSLESGIYYLPSKNNLSLAINGNVIHEKITALENLSDSILFFATSRNIIYKFNSRTHTLDKIDLKTEVDPTIEGINSLFYIASRKHLFVATESGSNTDVLKTYSRRWNDLNITTTYCCTRFIFQDDQHLMGSEYSFAYSLDLNTLSERFIDKGGFHPTVLYKNSKGQLLAGGLNGLYVHNGSSFVPFDSKKEILQKRVTDLGELGNKYLVIATRSDGIFLSSDTYQEIINTSNGLLSDNINHIYIQNNIIWASSNKGLNKIIIANDKPLKFFIEHYNINTGLLSEEINDFVIGNQNIYIATNDGLGIIKSEMWNNSSDEMPLYIRSVKINDRDTSILSSYSLSAELNTFNISYAAVSFRNATGIVYRYRLLGQDTIWRNTTNRDLQFTNVPPGAYKFQLLAQNGDMISPVPIEIVFNISPPYYKAIWFRLSAAFSFWMALFILTSWRIRSIKKKAEARNALNKKFSELNLNALRSQMNPHFTFNVLNSIQYYIAKKDSESAQMYITKFSRLIRMILDQSRTEFISLAEEIKMLTLYIELEELRFENKFTYTIEPTEKLNTSGIFIPGMLIQPFVENSIRHGIRHKKGNAHVDISFTVSDSILICTIADNGIGRQEAAKLKAATDEYKSVGTAIVDERIQALSILFDGKLRNYVSDLTDDNGNAAGTCVTIEIPFKRFTA